MRSPLRRRCLAALVAVSVLGMVPGAAAVSPETDAGGGRLLIFAMPGLTWADVAAHDLPALEEFFDQAALADLAPRGVSPRSGPGDAYLTISAGARATTVPGIDGQVLALQEQSSGSSAGEIYSRRTGLVPDGKFASLNWPALEQANALQPYDAELGLLAETLQQEGVRTAVIGNADGTDAVGSSHERQLALALADTGGVVADGALRRDLLRDDPSAVFGVRLDIAAVAGSFEEVWGGPEDREERVVLVEASDMARTLRYWPVVDAGRYATLWAEALADSDRMFARLMVGVDPSRDTVMVLAPYNRTDSRDLTAVAMRAPGARQGYLESASTQRVGFLTLVDVAPTVLEVFGVARPVEMEGRPAEIAGSGASLGARIDRLVSLNEASRFRERLLVPTTVAIVLTMVLVAAGTVAVIAGRWGPRWRRILAFTALAVLAAFPITYLARAFDLEDLGLTFYWGFLIAASLLVAGAAWAAGVRTRRPWAGLAVVLSLVAAVLVGDVVTGSRLSLSATFGYSPTGNSRLYGISNYSYGQLSAAVCLLAAIVAAPGGSRRRWIAVTMLVATLVVLGVPVWGSDVGGILAFTPTILVFVALVMRRRIRLRTVLAGGAASAAAVVAFGLLDLARAPQERAHLGRLFERLGNEGLEPLFSIVERKLLANLQVSVSSFWVAAIPVAAGFWFFLAHHRPRPLDPVRERLPTLGAGLAAALVAGVLGTLVNDSGAIVGGVVATVVAASLANLVLMEPAKPPAPASEAA